jgi:hypothetical protein
MKHLILGLLGLIFIAPLKAQTAKDIITQADEKLRGQSE